MSPKKSSVDFLSGLRSIEQTAAVRRHPAGPKPPVTTQAAKVEEVVAQAPQQPSRRGKVAITQWVDPAVRKQLARLAIDIDSSQAALLAEALNLLFERYGQPPIAASIQEDSLLLQPAD